VLEWPGTLNSLQLREKVSFSIAIIFLLLHGIQEAVSSILSTRLKCEPFLFLGAFASFYASFLKAEKPR